MCTWKAVHMCVCLHLRFVTIPLCKTLDFASEFANSFNNLARARLVHAPSIKYSRSYHTIDSAHTSILTNWQGKEYNFSMPKMQNSKFWPHWLTIKRWWMCVCVLANSLQKHCTLMPSEFKMSLLLLICQEKKTKFILIFINMYISVKIKVAK